MALESNNATAICWADKATKPEARIFPAFKWDEATGKRVPSMDPKRPNVQLRDKRPLQAHRGTILTGVVVAIDIKSTMMVLRREGVIAPVKINNGPAHEIVDGDGDRYALYMKTKGRALGWIPVGECPAAMVAHGIIAEHLVIADEAKDGKPCSRTILGERNPPCRHFWAELHAREAANKAEQDAREEAARSDGDKIMASNAQSMAAQAERTTELMGRVAETQAQLVAIAAMSRQADKPEKGGK